jgi:hypothetical protein
MPPSNTAQAKIRLVKEVISVSGISGHYNDPHWR